MTSPTSVLFVGGTGIISAACARQATGQGMRVCVLNRGRSGRPLPEGVEVLTADINDRAAVQAALGGREFDAVVDWVAFGAADIDRDLDLFGARTGQFVFISSASAYQTPPERLPIRETTPLSNPFWVYSREKIAAESRLTAEAARRGVSWTIVRPSHTYDETMVPFDGGWTAVQRMRDGKGVVVPGDGTSLWTITHSRDFAVGLAGLLGVAQAIGEIYHITTDEAITWNSIYRAMAAAADADPDLVHVPSDAVATVHPEWGAALLGDKSHSMIFDNTKIKRLVPAFSATTRFEEGAREIVAWHDAAAVRRRCDPAIDHAMDQLVAAYRPRQL
ncbi:NAD-dependent epimerase/dehydratase family protein [Actinoplanes sp. NPDC051411]|uniref:NAD-dependent epimerase/dehydratase family protein n=1 Tax=Actinoplanes sp. NPDC051411 TaxID=3155522 RepID=UPI00343D9B31